ncbi:MAG: methyltransferase domain-containing protein [Deltaproteobacteria bacterium]|nr:methyltransferase domain-containing protein [Deltaproteobacteria bacterium]
MPTHDQFLREPKENDLLSPEVLNRFESKLKYAHFSGIRESLEWLAANRPFPIKVLDVACGPGNMALFSEGISNLEWFGLELWPSELRQAANTGAYAGLCQANLVDKLPLRKGVMDAVVLNEILMYLGNAPKLMKEFFQILNPNGMLYVYNPIYTAPSLLAGFKKIGRQIHRSGESIAFDAETDWKRASRASRINFYSFDSLIEEVRKAGFEILEVSGFRIFRNRIRLMRELENYKWYREITKRFAKRNPRWASDILIIGQKQ